MAITSYGYYNEVIPGAVAAGVFTLAAAHRYWVEDQNAVKVTRVTGGTRHISIAPGRFGAWGIYNISDDSVTLQLPNPTSGTQWHLVYARHVWADGESETTFETEPCGTSPTRPGAFTDVPGEEVWQPLAYVPITAGQSDPGIPTDLRAQGTAGGAVAITSDLALPYYEHLGAELWLGRTKYCRVLNAAGTAQQWMIDPGPYGRHQITQGSSGWGSSRTGWTTSQLSLRAIRDGNHVEIDFRTRRTLANIAVSSTGHVVDVPLFDLNPEWRPSNTVYAACTYINQNLGNSMGLVTLDTGGVIWFTAGTPNQALRRMDPGSWSLSCTFNFIQQGA